ncbi:hypothetical protein A3D77_00550 [Candidatus Gottesmanbacteria bacterium RIFCSPHIGHO2_02_FULL_39_11]|uniref:PIN domain-containing protein n=1 Tax=Candidatus Gottesmanbacteria bacterium RIFCSPHIGHO2_02_FULL_39_11 TaxID=1798382 RepID=A0A1F5ZL29_9BACT|nr:MAG: hypothetical protein A3D77_00550 [Candidatus Gottesmanbacteria bacterium RIFCSPHIGHO2_02_FULL_39_11]
MIKLFLDSNCWIRYIVKDNQIQWDDISQLIESNENGNVTFYTSSIVFLEINFVLKKIYEFKFDEILDVLDRITKTRGITIIETTSSKKALEYVRKHHLKFSDSLIASQVSKDQILVTFDRDFSKIKDLRVKTPSQVLSLLNNN